MDAVFFSSYKMLKTPQVTTSFGPVTLLCGLKCGPCLFYLKNEESV